MTEVRRCTVGQTCTILDAGNPIVEELLSLIDIPAFGDERTEETRVVRDTRKAPRSIRIDERIAGRRDLWDAIGEAGWVIPGADGLPRYRRLRSLLVDKETGHPREAALAALAAVTADNEKLTKHAVFKRLGGTFISIGPVMAVIDAELGKPVREERRSLRAVEVPVAEFVGRYPIFARLEGTCEDREFPGRAEPEPAMLGRVDLMKSPDLASVLGLFLMASPGRLSRNCIDLTLRMIETIDEVGDASKAALGDAMVARLWAVVIEDRFQLPVPQRDKMVQAYRWTRSTMRELVDELPSARRAILERLVPPPLPDTFGVAATEIEDEAERQKDERRAETADPISQRRERFLHIAELRFRQADRLVDKIVADLRRISAALEAGKPVALPVTVNDTHHVIRPDEGGIGEGSQTISVRIETAAELWSQCAAADIAAGTRPTRSVAWNWLSAVRRQSLHPRHGDEAPHKDGDQWTPGLERELKVVYVGTRPVRPGGERVEPFWTALYRSRLFDADRDITPAERSERKALVDAIGFDPMKAPASGFFADTSTRGQSLTRAYRRLVSRARFIFPAEELRHTLAVGRVVLRPELMRGMRIGESSQARSDEGAFDFRKFNGKIYYYLAVVPKMAFGRSRRMVLDPTTVMAFERVREIAVERWFAAEGEMPVRPYHFKGKKLPDARYLLANDSGTLIYAEMNLCLRLLTIGVISSTSHSYKYGFAAMMKRGEAPDPILNRGLNHQQGSQNSDSYARFFTEHMVDAFIAEQQEESRKLELDYSLLEGVA